MVLHSYLGVHFIFSSKFFIISIPRLFLWPSHRLQWCCTKIIHFKLINRHWFLLFKYLSDTTVTYILLIMYLHVCLFSYSVYVYLYAFSSRLVVVSWRALFRRILRFCSKLPEVCVTKKELGSRAYSVWEQGLFPPVITAPTPCVVFGAGDE